METERKEMMRVILEMAEFYGFTQIFTLEACILYFFFFSGISLPK